MRHVDQGAVSSSVAGRGSQARGFTLIEVLTVIGIIAVLAGIVFPVFVAAREAARKTGCMSNMQQIGKAWLIYEQDYDERTPGGAYARFSDAATGRSVDGKHYTPLWVLLPYLKTEQVFVCPSRVGWDFSTTDPSIDTHRPRQGSYAANYQVMDVLAAQIERTSHMIAFCDSYNPWQDCYARCQDCGPGCSSLIWDRIGRGCYRADCSRRTDWHSGGIDLVFTDGHAKWSPLSRIYYGHWVLNLPETDPHYEQPITRDW